MGYCPICEKEFSQGNSCEQCGFDLSCDYEQYMTLTSGLPTNVQPISVRKMEWTRNSEYHFSYANDTSQKTENDGTQSDVGKNIADGEYHISYVKDAAQNQTCAKKNFADGEYHFSYAKDTATKTENGGKQSDTEKNIADGEYHISYVKDTVQDKSDTEKYNVADESHTPFAQGNSQVEDLKEDTAHQFVQNDKDKSPRKSGCSTFVIAIIAIVVIVVAVMNAGGKSKRYWSSDKKLNDADEAMMIKWEEAYEQMLSGLSVQADVDYTSLDSISEMCNSFGLNSEDNSIKIYQKSSDDTWQSINLVEWTFSNDNTTVSFSVQGNTASYVEEMMNQISILPDGVRFKENIIAELGITQEMMDWVAENGDYVVWYRDRKACCVSWAWSPRFESWILNMRFPEGINMEFYATEDGTLIGARYSGSNEYFQEYVY